MELPRPKPVNYFRLQNTCSSVLPKYHKDSYWHLYTILSVTRHLSWARRTVQLQIKAISTHNHDSGPKPLHSYTSYLKLLLLSVWYKYTPLCQQGSRVIINKAFSAKGAVINALGPLDGWARLMGGSISLAGRLFPQQNPATEWQSCQYCLKSDPSSIQTFLKEHHKI